MQKDFDSWNKKKKHLDILHTFPGFHEREIWYCNMGLNVGFEQDGKGDDYLRPVVIVRKFNNRIFWAIPLTSQKKNISENALRYYFTFVFVNNVQSVAILSQIRLVDAKRLSHRIGNMSKEDFVQIKKQLTELLP